MSIALILLTPCFLHARARSGKGSMVKKAYPAHPEVPISKAIRAGDFVFTSAYGPWTFDPTKVIYDAEGNLVDDGTGHKNVPFDEQVHLTFGFIREALAVAGCALDDVVDCQVLARRRARFRPLQRNLPHLFHQGPAGALRVSRPASCST